MDKMQELILVVDNADICKANPEIINQILCRMIFDIS